MSGDIIQYVFQVAEYLFIPEAYEADTKFFQKHLPVFVNLNPAIMYWSVKFDPEFFRMTVEINHHKPVASQFPNGERVLAHELSILKSAVS